MTAKRERHGMSKEPKLSGYHCWAMMKQRCYNKKYTEYHRYGGSGIRVCDEWVKSFSRFISDMGPRPSNNHSIDRIDSSGNYEPSNCRWATSLEQTLNRRINKNNKSGCTGVCFKQGKWRATVTVDYKQINLGSYSSKSEAIRARKEHDIHNKR